MTFFILLATVAISLLMIAPVVFFASSFLYICIRFRRGAFSYLKKTLAIGMFTVPMALMLTLWALWQLISIGISWIRRIWVTCVSRSTLDVETSPVLHHSDDVVVHLMHGTFESDAAWTQPDSPLCQAILKLNPSVKLNRFIWSGLNTHRARLEAANLFAEQIRKSASHHHYVVAHSHAGNIVRDASKHASDIAPKIKGVTLLSTPFIFRKVIERTGRSFVIAHSLGFAMIAQLPLALVLLPFDAYNAVTATLSMMAVFLFETQLSKRLQDQLNNELVAEQGAVDFREVQILHAIGDEADSLLRFTSFLHESCFGLFAQLQTTARQMRDDKLPYILSLGVLTIAMGATWLSGMPGWEVWVLAMFIVLLGILAAFIKERWKPSKEEPMVLMMLALPVGFISFWLAMAKSLAYGDWRLLFCPSVFICSSETPVGSTSKPIKYAPDNDGMLIHSTHSHKDAIRDVAEWLYKNVSR